MKLSNIFTATIMAAAAMLTLANTAMAQSKTLVIDQNKVINQSKAGKSAAKQFKTIAQTIQNEINSQVKSLETQGKQVQASVSTLKTQADFDANPQIAEQYKNFKLKEQKTAVEYQYKGAEMEKTQKVALAKIGKKVSEIVAAVARERGADTVVEARTLYYYNPSVDITQTVIARLDSQMPSISVVRERLPRQAQPAKGR